MSTLWELIYSLQLWHKYTRFYSHLNFCLPLPGVSLAWRISNSCSHIFRQTQQFSNKGSMLSRYAGFLEGSYLYHRLLKRTSLCFTHKQKGMLEEWQTPTTWFSESSSRSTSHRLDCYFVCVTAGGGARNWNKIVCSLITVRGSYRKVLCIIIQWQWSSF